jgi:bifunctional non-homologous end joining protein LigD
MPKTTKFVDLYFSDGRSDKVYHASIQEEGSKFIVNFAYGRRGNALQYGTKTTSPVEMDKAEKIYDKIVAEKVGKGYVERPGISGNIFGTISAAGEQAGSQTASIAVKESSGIIPQLCNEVSEDEAMALIKNPAWGAQEKKDGVHKLVKRKGDSISGINKKGQIVPLALEIAEALKLQDADSTLDGEQIGNVLHVFGMLEAGKKDMRALAYIDAYRTLEKFLMRNPSDVIQLLPLAVTAEDKLALFNSVKGGGREGVVFKRLSAPYAPGRPASGGDHLKFKFRADISAVVLGINDKRSVQIGVFADSSPDADIIPVGNVTIPPNHNVPKVDDVVDVVYLYAYKGGSLFQPQYKGKRDDVTRDECLASRIKFKAA